MNILSKTFIFLVLLLPSIQSFSVEREHYVSEDKDEINDQLDTTPDHLFTFTPKGGAELLHPNGDPTTVIRTYFDSEIVYVTDEGEYLDLTKENLLKMIEIKSDDGIDLATQSGPIDSSKVSFSNAGNKTTITINPPDTKAYYVGGSTLFGPRFSITIKSFTPIYEVEPEDLINGDVFSSYNVGYSNFFVNYSPDSCSIAGTTDTVEYAPHPIRPGIVLSTPKIPKADPNITHNIDIAFIISENHLNYRDLETWKQFLNEKILPKVNKIYQNSGANVQFNVKAVRPFSEYKNHLNCPIDLDGLYADQGLTVLSELVPRIRYDTGVDLIYGLHDYAQSDDDAPIVALASTRKRNDSTHISSRWYSYGSLDFSSTIGISRWHAQRLLPYESQTSVEIEVFSFYLTHEIGHNLGLEHQVYTSNSSNFTGWGYGYINLVNIGGGLFPYSTIMDGSPVGKIRLPFFSSSSKEIRWSDVCKDDVFKHMLESTISEHDLCDNVSKSDDPLLQLGTEIENSQYALQYTIEDVSNYSELHRVNK